MIPTLSNFRLLMRIMAILVSGVLITFGAILLSIITQFDGSDPEFPIDCAVVFGAAVGKGSTPGPGIIRRTETAARLYKEGKVNKLILTGGKGSKWQEESEAEVMRKVAMISGVAPEDIVLEEESTSTWENLENVKELGVDECTTNLGISDRYHLARINYLANLQEWGILETYPADIKSNIHFELVSVIRETFGFVFYALRFQK